MPDPTRTQFHVDGPLSDISVAYMQDQEDYIADQVFPVVEVDKQSDLYFVYTKGFWMRNVVERRAPGDTYPEGRFEMSTDSYYCNLYHLGYGIPDEDKSNEDPGVDLEITGSEWLSAQFLLNREITIAADVFAAVWGTNVVGGVDYILWDDYDNSNPVTDVNTAKQTIQQSTGKKANTLVMGKEVFDVLTEHPILLDKYKHTAAGILDQEEIRKALKVDKLVVGEAVYESTAEGAAAATRGYIWGGNALLCHVPANPGKRVAAAGYTFVWRLTDAGRYTVAISNTRQDWRDRDLLKGKHAFDHKITGTDLGYFFGGAIA